ncbi:TspO/MBR-related protein [Pseudovirgaria hyperparasitica]|uniref:TspO/MBR-related protein n=1 Tax=Pseudovirgaria hyperparasitica TaxID=470096 RepID=A0A6A6W271_9PEZI|nr:TspO/MBR-related protein [Pseudovirgaria hyperparasitica]KAF2756655.1 TspO/MBR-related protein [Pseudovirgaria hyperparasitica]
MTSHIPSMTLPRFVFEAPAASILLPVALGTAIGYSTRPKRTKATYATLKNPPGNPPAWVFGPTWTGLYAMMGYSAYRAWNIGMSSMNPHTVELAKHGATLYTIQLGLNLIWMPLFFGMGKPIAASVDIVALTSVTGYLAYIWGQVDATSGWLLAPYLAWLGFANYLCHGAGYLNNWDFSGKVGTFKRQ